MIILTRRLTNFNSALRLFQFHNSIYILICCYVSPCRTDSKFKVRIHTQMTSAAALKTLLIPRLEGISMKRTSFKLCSLALRSSRVGSYKIKYISFVFDLIQKLQKTQNLGIFRTFEMSKNISNMFKHIIHYSGT